MLGPEHLPFPSTGGELSLEASYLVGVESGYLVEIDCGYPHWLSPALYGNAFKRALLRQRALRAHVRLRSEEHTSELQSLMRISYAVFCLKKTINHNNPTLNSKHA